MCPKTFCWGLRCSWNEVEVGLTEPPGEDLGVPGSPPDLVPPLQPKTRCWWWAKMSFSCSWWTQPGR